MSTQYNSRPILLNEGAAYLDGVKFLDCVTVEINATLGTWQGSKLGSKYFSSRTTSAKFSGTITERRTTPWTRKILQEYLDSGKTVEFKITGRLADKNSDYYDTYGSETVTCVGCVLTGDISLLHLDADSEDVLTDSISINIYKVKFS